MLRHNDTTFSYYALGILPNAPTGQLILVKQLLLSGFYLGSYDIPLLQNTTYSFSIVIDDLDNIVVKLNNSTIIEYEYDGTTKPGGTKVSLTSYTNDSTNQMTGIDGPSWDNFLLETIAIPPGNSPSISPDTNKNARIKIPFIGSDGAQVDGNSYLSYINYDFIATGEEVSLDFRTSGDCSTVTKHYHYVTQSDNEPVLSSTTSAVFGYHYITTGDEVTVSGDATSYKNAYAFASTGEEIIVDGLATGFIKSFRYIGTGDIELSSSAISGTVSYIYGATGEVVVDGIATAYRNAYLGLASGEAVVDGEATCIYAKFVNILQNVGSTINVSSGFAIYKSVYDKPNKVYIKKLLKSLNPDPNAPTRLIEALPSDLRVYRPPGYCLAPKQSEKLPACIVNRSSQGYVPNIVKTRQGVHMPPSNPEDRKATLIANIGLARQS